MNRAIELIGSTISAIFQERRKVVVKLCPTYVHASHGRPGVDEGTGFYREVHLELIDPLPHVVLGRVPCQLETASLTVSEERFDNFVRLPMVGGGQTEFNCMTSEGESLRVRARGIAVVFYGNQMFPEHEARRADQTRRG